MPPPAAGVVVDQHRALSNPVRVRLLKLLRGTGPGDGSGRDASVGRDAASLAADLDLHANTVRFHLDVLQQAGLVTRRAETRRVRGRPRMLFRAVPQREADAGEDRYRLLAALLTDALEDQSDPPVVVAERAGERWGARLVQGRTAGRSADAGADPIDLAVGLLDELGFEPRVEPSTTTRIELHQCPYRVLAADHRDVVCGAHLGLLRGMLGDRGVPMDEVTLTPFVTDTMCVATVGD